jgi:hypothetical protein
MHNRPTAHGAYADQRNQTELGQHAELHRLRRRGSTATERGAELCMAGCLRVRGAKPERDPSEGHRHALGRALGRHIRARRTKQCQL